MLPPEALRLIRNAENLPYEPDALDVLVALGMAASSGDRRAAAFLPVFEDWVNAQQTSTMQGRRGGE
jgi:hypothetical protein